VLSVNTETTDYSVTRGTLFYDAQCPLCRAALKCVGPIFARRRFHWLPLQSPGAVQRLGIPEAALLEEMKLQLPDGRVLGGIDSWIYLCRSVWWLGPLGLVLSVPGLHAVAQAAYRWIARNRYCLGGKCSRPRPVPRRRRKIPFLDFP